mmetsp:Transcript_27770/g.57811  ORF Transcript_27770/g.57811 Transcript_27770/m.57811 type:complete len:207 (-) Transcript_27770:510-1130(-)
MANSCPNNPSSLFELTHRTNNLGNAFCKSATNCSATQSETSHPVTRMSTCPPWLSMVPSTRAFILARMQLARFQAVMRFKPTSCQSSWMREHTLGMSRMSARMGSGQSSRRGLTNSLRSRRVSLWDRWQSRQVLLWWWRTTRMVPFISVSTGRFRLGRDTAGWVSPAYPQSRRQISPPKSSRSNRTALSASLEWASSVVAFPPGVS